MTYKEILDTCVPQSKRYIEKCNPWEYYTGRLLSIVVTKPLLNTNITPSTVTFWSILFSLAGFGLISFGDTVLLRSFGWLGFFIWGVLDCVDGNIARCKNLCSSKGELWDALGGYLTLTLMFFSAGIAAFYDNNSVYIFENYWYLIFGGMTSMLSILPRLMAQKKKAIMGAEAVEGVMNKTKFSLSKIIARNIESSAGLMQLVLLLCIVFHFLNVYVIFYFLFNILIAVYSIYTIVK